MQLGIDFMFVLQDTILKIIPVIWPWFQRAMQLRHGIDIGTAKAPLMSPPLPWTDEEILAMVTKLESFGPSK